jgi:hypothetical protein
MHPPHLVISVPFCTFVGVKSKKKHKSSIIPKGVFSPMGFTHFLASTLSVLPQIQQTQSFPLVKGKGN